MLAVSVIARQSKPAITRQIERENIMIAQKILKEISFAFPTSTNAETLGFADTGCFHISMTYVGVEGSDQCVTFMPHNAEGFTDKNAPDLLALYNETDGQCAREFYGIE